jgi:16S rRNA (guanine527-N7)-methyltransferase
LRLVSRETVSRETQRCLDGAGDAVSTALGGAVSTLGDAASSVLGDAASSALSDVVSAALDLLAARYRLGELQREQLAVALRCLETDEQAPTAVREAERALDVHLADSLVALELSAVREAGALADMGAGAGFPGLALAVALPAGEMTLVDSVARKCAFVERVRAAARIANARVLCARVEEWPEGIGAHDVVLARALGPQPVVLEYAAPLLRLGGSLVDWRGRRDADEERAGAAAAEQLGLERSRVQRVEPFAGVREHHLHVYVKRRETPDRFPRRAGMARKRPLA